MDASAAHPSTKQGATHSLVWALVPNDAGEVRTPRSILAFGLKRGIEEDVLQ